MALALPPRNGPIFRHLRFLKAESGICAMEDDIHEARSMVDSSFMIQ